MKILKRSLFDTPKSRSPSHRNKILFIGNKANFQTFGKSYFDGKKILPGYGGYRYDSRYFNSVKQIINLLKLEKKERIVELGCAKGFILFEFWKLGFKNIYGQDISSYAKNNSKPEIKKFISTKCISKIQAKNNSVKFLFCKETLPHLTKKKLKKTFSEISRTVKKDGIIYFEIQTGRTDISLKKMRQWDPTHKILERAHWWKRTIQKAFPKNYNLIIYFKYLF